MQYCDVNDIDCCKSTLIKYTQRIPKKIAQTLFIYFATLYIVIQKFFEILKLRFLFHQTIEFLIIIISRFVNRFQKSNYDNLDQSPSLVKQRMGPKYTSKSII